MEEWRQGKKLKTRGRKEKWREEKGEGEECMVTICISRTSLLCASDRTVRGCQPGYRHDNYLLKTFLPSCQEGCGLVTGKRIRRTHHPLPFSKAGEHPLQSLYIYLPSPLCTSQKLHHRVSQRLIWLFFFLCIVWSGPAPNIRTLPSLPAKPQSGSPQSVISLLALRGADTLIQ